MNKWDEKAKNYTRYEQGNDRFEAKILGALEELHVSLDDKKIIDIGCGTGVYTLRVAQKALHVDGIDSSKEMLNVLREDAKELHLNNIVTIISSWSEYKIKSDKYDIALCTMSPAVNDEYTYKKMSDCAHIKIYLGWAGKRSSMVLEKIFEAHNKTYIPPNGAQKLKKWLDNKKIPYQLLAFDEERETKKEFEKALKNFVWHLEVRGIIPDENKIREVLESCCDKDKNIIENMTNHMNLIAW